MTILCQRSSSGARPFKYHLSVNVHTITLRFPGGGAGSDSGSRGVGERVESLLVLKMKSLLLSNKYSSVELSGAGGEGYYGITETMQLDLHQLSGFRQDAYNNSL